MSAISLKSITGITSITTPAGVDNQLTLHTNNTTERVKITAEGNVHINNHLAVLGVSTHNDHVQIIDGKRLKVGSAANGDLILLHTGTDSIIDNATGNLFYRSATHKLQALNAEDMIVCNTNGSVELYHDNTKRIETTNTGAVVSGIATVSTRLNINTVSNARLAVAGTNYAWRGQFMIKDTTTGASAMPYMTFWDGSEANDGSNTGLLGRAGHVNGGGINERFDFWTYRSTTPLSLGTNGYERLRILPAGQTLITTNINGNTISARTVLSNYTPTLQIEGNSKSSTSASLTANVNNAVGPSLWFAKTRGTSLGSNTAAQSGDELGTIVFNGADGTDIQTMGSYIRGVVDGSVSSNNVPGRLQFHTATGGTMYERLRITSSGTVSIASNNYNSGHADTKLRVGTESGSTQSTAVIGSADQDVPALTITNWDGSATTNKNVIRFDNSGRGTYEIGGMGGSNEFGIFIDNLTTPKLKINASGNITQTGSSYIVDSTASAEFILDRANTSSGATVSYKTGGTLKWYNGLRGLVNDDFYLRSEGGNLDVLYIQTYGNIFHNCNSAGNPAGITIKNVNTNGYSHARLRLESENAARYADIWCDKPNEALRLAYNSSNSIYFKSDGRIGINANPSVNHEYLHIKPVGNNVLDLRYELNSSTDIRHKFYDDAGVWRGGFNYTTYANSSEYPNFHDSFYFLTDPGSNGSLTAALRITREGQFIKPLTYQFLVASSGVSVSGGWTKLTGMSIDSNHSTGISNGTYWSNSNQRFTAPVTGTYNFFIGGFSSTAEGGGTNHRYMYVFVINGGNYLYGLGGNYSDGNTPMEGGSINYKLSVNDYVEVYYYTAISATWGNSSHRFYWGGYFLG